MNDGVNKDIVSGAPTKREKRRAREAVKKAKAETQTLVSCKKNNGIINTTDVQLFTQEL
jgi:hypothetical protein